jgi:hypothetical protein
MAAKRVLRALLCLSLISLAAPVAFSQQTGSVSGHVTSTDGAALPGATVEARSVGLPQPRVTVTSETGEYRLPQLQPGPYTLTFTLAGLQTMTRNVNVLLGQNATVNVSLGMEGVSESITVTAESTLVDRESSEISSAVSTEMIESLPIGQEYRDLVRLAPGVQITQDAVRGPSAGGSGQDNVYQFDGVNVTLPLYGTLSAEPSSHDIAQVNVIRGGAKATDFNRAAGFTIDSVSKSGTNEFMGEISYQVQNANFNAKPDITVNSTYEQDRSWATLSLGGPVLADRLFFYGSYYRPERRRDNRANLYGDLPNYSSERNEYFGKLTYTPTASILINGSFRDSDRLDKSDLFASNASATTGTGAESHQQIGILEASWVISSRSYATFKYTDFTLETAGRPDVALNVPLSIQPGTKLDLANLDQMGRFFVPSPGTNAAANAFFAQFIERYGYVGANGQRVGGGIVGVGTQFDNDDFFRTTAQIGYDFTFGSNVTHDLHVGYQRNEDAEDLLRTSNGWGDISVIGGTSRFPNNASGQPIFFQASFQQQTLEGPFNIHSEYRSQNFEINDTIRWGDWSFNAGVLVSRDDLYGQGLREDSSALSGYVNSPGTKYRMYTVDWDKMIQPRLGATWAYNGTDTVYTSFARYNPAVSSLPRAASWARSFQRTLRAYFDQSGTLFAVDPVPGSSGKLFMDDLDPRTTDEFLLGTAQQLTPRFSLRAYGRYRYSSNFWEDTNNNARVDFAPPEGYKRELYIPDLPQRLAQIGSGSSYVIAELEGAFSKYWEATAEADWRAGRAWVKGSYTWSHYYGTMDQDNTSPAPDQNLFVGSSNAADDPGRQMWDNKYGDLRGDRRHMLKLYGAYQLPWNAHVGALTFFQSGQPYELWSWMPYAHQTANRSDTYRFAEPAGRRRTPDHYQLDLNYTQDIALTRGFGLQFVADVYNVFDKQTGYNFENRVGTLGFTDDPSVAHVDIPENIPDVLLPAGRNRSNYWIKAPFARNSYDPRRFQLALRLNF